MGSTTPHALRYPEYGTGADPKRDIQYLAEDVAPKLYRAEPLTTAQISAITAPRIGQLVLNTTTGRVLFWNGSAWRPVGGVIFGGATIGSVTFTSTYQEFSYFIGAGVDEVNFTLSVTPLGGVNQYGASFTAVSDPIYAQGVAFSQSGSNEAAAFVPLAATDFATMQIFRTDNNQARVRVRNMRLANGMLVFEMSSAAADFTSHSSFRMNWRAR